MISKYLSKPWHRGGRGPDHYDCWGLIWKIYRDEKGVVLPDFPGVENPSDIFHLFSEEVGNVAVWTEVPHPSEFDIVCLGIQNRVSHCGLFVNSGVLHAKGSREGVLFDSLLEIHRLYKTVRFFKYNG